MQLDFEFFSTAFQIGKRANVVTWLKRISRGIDMQKIMSRGQEFFQIEYDALVMVGARDGVEQ